MQYRPLIHEKEEIRLLTIIPNPENAGCAFRYTLTNDEPIHCRLGHFSLEKRKFVESTILDEPTSSLGWDDIPGHSSCADPSQWRYHWGDYVALSYTWGDLDNKRTVMANGHATHVGGNLEVALRALSIKRPMLSGCKLWVDALCINQRDVEERNEQVKRMRKIYKEAHEVVI